MNRNYTEIVVGITEAFRGKVELNAEYWKGNLAFEIIFIKIEKQEVGGLKYKMGART